MNSTVNGHPVIPRTGYIVEFNALWYNALRLSLIWCVKVVMCTWQMNLMHRQK